jgi:RluA family pseudouridine synthase
MSARSDLPTGLTIVHEDVDVLVVDKPAGLRSATPGADLRTDDSVFGLLKRRARERRSGRLWIIHRLDQPASGLLVFARSERAFAWLKESLKSRRMERTYTALVEGELAAGSEGTLTDWLRERQDGQVVPAAEGGDARLAVTHWRSLACGRGRSVLELRLGTGRKHQLRVQLAAAGHPIVGDRRYGQARSSERPARAEAAWRQPSRPGQARSPRAAAAAGRLCLHASRLAFPDPATGALLAFESRAPRAFFELAGARAPRPGAPRAPLPRGSAVEPSSEARAARWLDGELEGFDAACERERLVPGLLRLLEPRAGMRVVELVAGEPVLCAALARIGAEARAVSLRADPKLGELPAASLDAVACPLALVLEPAPEAVLAAVARALVPGGACVFALPHPAFFAPRQSRWTWRDPTHQSRACDGYLSAFDVGLAEGTRLFHRPLQLWVKACADAGFAVERLEEWPGSAGPRGEEPRAREMRRAHREFPLFVGIRVTR